MILSAVYMGKSAMHVCNHLSPYNHSWKTYTFNIHLYDKLISV